MHEFIPQDLTLACHSAGLTESHSGRHTPRMAEIIEGAGPLLAGRDETDAALITEIRLATGPMLEMLKDDEIARLVPFLRQQYEKQSIPGDPL